MNKQTRKLLEDWRDDLRTTTATQTTGIMYDPTNDSYCAIGRLQKIRNMRLEKITGNEPRMRNSRGNDPVLLRFVYDVEHAFILHELATPYLERKRGQDSTIIWANDGELMSFQEIADILDIILLETQ